MIVTPIDVQRVARTAQPYKVRDNVVLDIDYVVKRTQSHEWDGALYQLGATAAMQLADQFNLENNLIANSRKSKAAVSAK